jgi:general secretion pathway protein J
MKKTRQRHGEKNKQTAGFTLLEAMIAMALMALVLTALATITAQWLPSWNKGMARTQRHEQTALGIERIVADLAAAEFIPPSRGSRGPTFNGAPQSVIFVRILAGPQPGPGLEIVRIAEAGTAREPVVIRTHTRFVPRVASQHDPIDYRDPVVLLRAPYRLSFSYAGRDRVWRDRWQELELPSAIRLTLQDVTTRQTMSVSTATSVHSELSADCIHAKSFDECLNPAPQRPEGADGRSRS